MKLLVLYHSGVGATKYVAQLLAKAAKQNGLTVTLCSIENIVEPLNTYDLLCLGFPTYHGAPSSSMQKYIQQLTPLTEKLPAFIFTTCGLYSANTLRIFARQCYRKNIVTRHSASYRSPASDGTLMLPQLNFMQHFVKDLEQKIQQDLTTFLRVDQQAPFKLPRFKFYSLLNGPNKWAGQNWTPAIQLQKERCIRCRKCLLSCPHQCFSETVDGYPDYTKKDCEHCYRCIHHCPAQALNIFKDQPPKVQLNHRFFKELEH